nr:hypothetical protein [Deltaproteobacteria bacterium]
MPEAAFEVLKPAVQSLLGGRRADLVPADNDFSSRDYVSKPIHVGSEKKRIRVAQKGIKLTPFEAELLNQTAKAFAVLFNRFESTTGYKAHLRTAISSSVMDITLARFLRGKRSGGFASVQSLIQVLKRLSYERYEGSPATTGFLVFRTKQETVRDKITSMGCYWIDLTPVKIDNDFFGSPLTYRFVDGNHNFFATGIQMKAVATIRSRHSFDDAVDRLGHANLYRLLEISGENAFAAILNNSSEIEVILPRKKIIVWRKGVWNIFDPDIFHFFFHDALGEKVINELLWTVYSLSKTRHGTLILITGASKKELEDFRKGSVAGNHLLSEELIKKARDTSISSLKSRGDLIRMLSADGLTIVNYRGQLVDTGVITDTSRITKGKAVGGGRTTAAIAASSLGKVIKVSEDGPIELYENQSLRYRFG